MMNLSRKLNRYTLIEMILVLAIMVLAAVAVMAAASGGIQIFKRARDYREARVQMILALQRIERDITNAFQMDTLQFSGAADRVRIPAVIFRRTDADGPVREPGQAAYYVDAREGGLIRETRTYAQATASQAQPLAGARRILAVDVERIQFRYYHYSSETLQYGWTSVWDREEGELPLAVEVALFPAAQRRSEPLTATVLIPAAVQEE